MRSIFKNAFREMAGDAKRRVPVPSKRRINDVIYI